MSEARSAAIRVLDEDDAPAFRRLRLRALRDHPDAFGQAFDEALALPVDDYARRLREGRLTGSAFVLGAFLDGQLVGIVGCLHEQGRKARHKARIWGMYVAAEARGRGVGRALLAATIERAREWAEVEQVRLTVVTENVAARRLYESFGFQPYGLERGALKLDGRYLDEQYLVLRLREPGSPDPASDEPSDSRYRSA